MVAQENRLINQFISADMYIRILKSVTEGALKEMQTQGLVLSPEVVADVAALRLHQLLEGITAQPDFRDRANLLSEDGVANLFMDLGQICVGIIIEGLRRATKALDST
eukprot:gnl/MRDRNA2_/MRDRNA2_267597_c0_seq1.p1 gnl/MRDRNA2_/MRDRNA2_267597_c0~~gnl/MRDRNA2_/MRDRNA2_267597_c0_seq1.p1  ORF type:complete len:108 (+),score=20.38 gnl/MRDRNA2_/MRDRNA2_267597_c0_seq1:434-757(+)